MVALVGVFVGQFFTAYAFGYFFAKHGRVYRGRVLRIIGVGGVEVTPNFFDVGRFESIETAIDFRIETPFRAGHILKLLIKNGTVFSVAFYECAISGRG